MKRIFYGAILMVLFYQSVCEGYSSDSGKDNNFSQMEAQFFEVIKTDDMPKIKSFIENESMPLDMKMTTLIYAIETGNESLFNLIREGINLKELKGEIPLLCRPFLMGATVNLRIIYQLLKLGVNPNQTDKNGQTPLHLAVSNGNVEAVIEFLNNGADPEKLDHSGFSPRELALQEGTPDMIKAFKLPIDADVNDRLRYAASIGDISEIQNAINDGADLNFIDKAGNTILIQAVNSGNIEAVKEIFFLAKKNHVILDINQKNISYGISALHTAVASKNNSVTLVKLLLTDGQAIDVNIQYNYKQTPLFWVFTLLINGSIEFNMAQSLIDLLLTAGASPYQEDNDGNTPLRMAQTYAETNPIEGENLIKIMQRYGVAIAGK